MKAFFTTFSKILGFFFALVFIIFFLSILSKSITNNSYFSYLQGNINSKQKIAIFNINGPIISEPPNFYNFKFLQSLEVIYPSLIRKHLGELEEEEILGLIVSMNSPGGSVSASQKIYNLFKKFKNTNNIPVYFHTTDMLASGGYWVSLSGDKIFASYGSLVGSIGVKGPDWIYYNSPTSISTGILGSSVESSKEIQLFSNIAGKSKDIFNPFRPPTKKEIIKLQNMINDIYNDFVNLVSSNRKIEKKIIKNEIGAMIFNSKQAKEHYLIDDQKNIDQIIDIFSKKLNLDSALIISNVNNNKSQILNFNYLLFLANLNKIDYYNNLIKNKFCNNLLNEVSAVASNPYQKNC